MFAVVSAVDEDDAGGRTAIGSRYPHIAAQSPTILGREFDRLSFWKLTDVDVEPFRHSFHHRIRTTEQIWPIAGSKDQLVLRIARPEVGH